MKKILFVIDSLNSGGAEKSLVSLLNLLDYQKYSVDLLMFSPAGLYLPLLSENVNIIEVPEFIKIQNNNIKYLIKNKNFKELYIRLRTSVSLRNPYNKKNMHTAQSSWRWMSKGINKLHGKYDIAIAYSQGTPTYFVAEKVEATKKLCWVNTDYKLALYNKNFDIKYYKQYTNVIAVSDHNREVFINEIPIAKEKTRVIYDIVSPKLIRSMALNSLNNGGFKDKHDGLRILTIGRLVDAKGYDMAIEACYMLKKQGYNFKWYVIGEGVLKNKLENMIKEFQLENTFVLLGTFQNPYVFLKQCDIYVQPSRFEGYGLALAEARIFQKPIVATNFTVVHNQLRNRENGLIVNMNSQAICKGIKEIVDNNNLKESLCSNLSDENVGTEQEINKLYSIIESL
ncbi:glycosyltransferase [Priestia aryabhattai]|uniref:glycosyltransferase n=1 Tax=Priestia TaxID=2800373 RepID=UPI000E123EAB|nr:MULTISPECIES: glycosyltransferase [Priestia]MBY0007039.1 glycosyltransferase [Priestia aryabhattai]MBY0048543.1 glycosyltransferase [Priestia aryabhattai]NLR43294.1 glycosyltransferase [Priestia megaterium]SUV05552.1 group 1 glycosyl transferase [Priestia megaterium]